MLIPLEGLLGDADVSAGTGSKGKVRGSAWVAGGGSRNAGCQDPIRPSADGRKPPPPLPLYATAKCHCEETLHTDLGGGVEATLGGVPRLEPPALLLLFSLSAGGLLDATEANVDSAGSCIEPWLPRRWW
jgi:hypothetical protein